MSAHASGFQQCSKKVLSLSAHIGFRLGVGECYDHQHCQPQPGSRGVLQLPALSSLSKQQSSSPCPSKQVSGRAPCLSSLVCTSRQGGVCNNGVSQHLHFLGISQLCPAPLADASRSANESPSHIISVLFKLLLFCWVWGD